MIELQIAATVISGHVPAKASLENRIKAAMAYAKTEECDHEAFWMVRALDDDLRMRAAIAAVYRSASDDEKDCIEKSLKVLLSLTAMLRGVPVDVEQVKSDGTIPLMKIWHEA